jgi:hypothetical protein
VTVRMTFDLTGLLPASPVRKGGVQGELYKNGSLPYRVRKPTK